MEVFFIRIKISNNLNPSYIQDLNTFKTLLTHIEFVKVHKYAYCEDNHII